MSANEPATPPVPPPAPAVDLASKSYAITADVTSAFRCRTVRRSGDRAVLVAIGRLIGSLTRVRTGGVRGRPSRAVAWLRAVLAKDEI